VLFNFELINAKMGALAEQFPAIDGPNGHRRRPNPRYVEEED
jgi:hypothetical protein